MLGRALSLATVMVLIGCFGPVTVSVQAQNLEAGKSPSQIFAGTCAACHKSPRGLLRTVPPGSLPGFLREHYTTSSGMASLLSGYLISNGASDTRYGGGQPRPGARPEARSGGEPEYVDRRGRRMSPPREVAEPPGARTEADRLSGPAEPRRRGRNARRQDRAGEGSEGAKPAELQTPAQQANQHGRDGRKARHRPAKPGKPAADEQPGMGAVAPATGNEAAKPADAKPEAANPDAGRQQLPAAAEKPPGDGAAEAAKVEPAPTASTPAPGGPAAASNAAPEHTSTTPAAPSTSSQPTPAATPAPPPSTPDASPGNSK
jgi:hypothetical protein